ncbi:ABC transporter substrate-binding protein [Paroceanicella profunda]|uniref:ABC transporter substrate-binding protein n=1 Tax=Paroceanicella profunda TaxID=2579971 RepID=A0A5B8FHQ1_9RHOB|nr:extracellular solute-binding protein [Paroceanicella profunda]QDL92447.1 ABC transporter substrate-binding protein [Paroceanicella profunda]
MSLVPRSAPWRAAFAAIAMFAAHPLPLGAETGADASDAVTISHGLSVFGDLKYPEGFPHFDYVNPDAPKGGLHSTWAFGTFDSLNPFILKGNSGQGLGLLFDSLMTGSADEPDSQYGLVASKVEYPADRSWVIFDMRPEATFSDGSPLTADDVVFTFETLRDKGTPSYAIQFQDFESVEALDPHKVKFTFRAGASTRDLPLTAGQMPILSRAYYDTHDFTESTMTPPLGSGPYAVERADPGRSITFERRDDYWAKDLPVNVGQNNFDEIRFEYYGDYTAAFEAFKGGGYNFREEYLSKLWAESYHFPAIDKGWVKTEVIPDATPSGTQGFWFNMRREKFRDPRVREALAMVFNFEWSNKALFYDQYKRTASFWENSELKAEGMPTQAELKLLEPLRADLPEAVFTEPAYVPPVSSTERIDRRVLRQAGKLLDAAGWTVRNGLRTNAKGEVLSLVFLNDSPSMERIITPYVDNLRQLGVDASLRSIDAAQEEQRRKSFDYDITSQRYVMSMSPGDELRQMFGSQSAETPGSANLTGLSNPAVDTLIADIVNARDRDELNTAVHALDRVLRAMHLWVPNWYKGSHTIAYLDVFGRPDPLPAYSMGELSLWWWDEARAAKLRAEGALR